ncbi:MAG: polysaccharide biosynthesis protein [Clostridia bacterium]|nr:polysaccharide biosynthesis protein [Clostridia bacterium]MBR6007343.1 polysaccharide biosynthesis protein [Clostridia bacterium]
MESSVKATKKTSFVQGAAILGIAGLLVKIIGAVYRIPLANIVGKTGMSYYEVAYPYYSWLLVISSAGLPTAISKLVSERIALGDVAGAKKVFRSAMRLLFIIGVATTILLFAASGGIAKLSGAPEAMYSLMALSPALFFVSIMCAYRGYLQGMQCMTGTALSQLAEQFVKLIIGFSLAAMFIKSHPDRPELAAMGALIGVSISELAALGVIVGYYLVRMKRGTLPVCLPGRNVTQQATLSEITKKLLLIAIPITIGASIMPVTGIADSIFIINILRGRGIASGLSYEAAADAAKGAYAVLRSYVTPLINMPAVLTLALSMSLVPAISHAVTRRERRTVNSASRTGIKLAMFIGAPCAAGLFVLGGPIMALLFRDVRNDEATFLLAQKVMYFAAIGVLFLSLVQTLTGIIQGIGKPRVPVYFLAVGGVVKVVSMIILMRFTRLGILGAAISTVLCYAIAGIGDTIYVIKKTGMSLSYEDTFFKPIAASLLMGFIVFVVYSFARTLGHPTVGTLAAIVVGIAVYIAAMILMRPFSASDLEFLPKSRLVAKLFRIN